MLTPTPNCAAPDDMKGHRSQPLPPPVREDQSLNRRDWNPVADELHPYPLTRRTIHICVDMQRLLD
jgi:hypothetical protein